MTTLVLSRGAELIDAVAYTDASSASITGGGRNRSVPLYSDSALYVARASRGERGERGSKVASSNVSVTFGSRRGYGHVALLGAPNDAFDFLCLRTALEFISESIGLPLIVKKVRPAVAEYLVAGGGFLPVSRVLDPSVLEDDSWPELLLNLERTLAVASHASSKVARKVKRYIGGPWPRLESHLCASSDREMALSALRALGDAGKRQAYQAMIELALERVGGRRGQRRRGDVDVLVYLSRSCGGPPSFHGLYVTERLSRRTAGLYCALTSRDRPGLTEYLDVMTFRRLFAQGVYTLLLGGSETPGVYQYIHEKLAPAPLRYPGATLVMASREG